MAGKGSRTSLLSGTPAPSRRAAHTAAPWGRFVDIVFTPSGGWGRQILPPREVGLPAALFEGPELTGAPTPMASSFWSKICESIFIFAWTGK